MAKVKELLWNANEGVTSADLNAMQRFARAQINDLWGGLARELETDVVASVNHLYCMGHSGAPYAGGSARTLAHRGGWIAQNIGGGAITGDDPEFLFYYLDLNEFAQTLDVGDATNPRYDLICVKLDHLDGDNETRHTKNPTTGVKSSSSIPKRRNVRCQVQLVAGTPAGSPVEPAVPSGYLKLAAVYVPATWNAVIDPTNILDYRMPIGFEICDRVGSDWTHELSTSWDSGHGYITAPALPVAAYGLCSPRGWGTSRVLRIGYAGARLASSTGTLDLRRVDIAGTVGGWDGAGAVALSDYNIAALLPAADGDSHYAEVSLLSGPPLWANGYRAGYAMTVGLSPPYTWTSAPTPPIIPRVGLKFTADGTRQDIVQLARFYVAGGM